MSEPATQPQYAVASAPETVLAPRTRAQALRGFAVDAMLTVVLSTGLSVLGFIAWGAWHIHGGRDTHAVALPNAMAVLWVAGISTGATALVLAWWRRPLARGEAAQSWRRAMRASAWGQAVLVGTGAYACSAVLGWLAEQAGTSLQPSNLQALAPLVSQRPWVLFVFAVCVAPLYEELLFRRVLFGRLWRAGFPWLGAVLSAALFALMHELPRAGVPLQATLWLWLDYGLLALAFAWVYWRTGTLWAAIGAHALNNLLALATAVLLH